MLGIFIFTFDFAHFTMREGEKGGLDAIILNKQNLRVIFQGISIKMIK